MSERKNKGFGKRSKTRLAAIKALYSYQINKTIDIHKTAGQLVLEIIELYYELDSKNRDIDQDMITQILKGTIENLDLIDEKIAEKLEVGWSLNRLGVVILSILRLGFFEIMNNTDIHANILIDDYVNQTRKFFDDKESGFVNGILQKLATEVRD